MVDEPTSTGAPAGDAVAEPRGTLEPSTRWVLAGFSVGAAAVHFAYTQAHFSEYWLYGAFFAVVAWLQVLWAAAVMVRRDRSLLAAGAALNLFVVGVWVASRTVGVWVGPSASVKEAASFPDVFCSALEALVALLAVALLVRPGVLARRVAVRGLAPIAASAVLVLVAGSAAYALSPRFADAHDHAGGNGSTATGNSPCEQAGPPASEGQVLDGEGHFHRGPAPQQPIDEATRVALQAQQGQARAVAAKYPTVADAEAAGYRKSTVYVPCIGAHYTNTGLAVRFDPAAPSELLYDGTAPTSRIVGLSYLVYHPGGAPDGFAGPNDVWHQHNFNGGLCIDRSGVVVGAESTTKAQCEARGGRKVPLDNIWMVHDWVVPGWECSWGVFASECPELGGRVGGTAYDAPDPAQKPIPGG